MAAILVGGRRTGRDGRPRSGPITKLFDGVAGGIGLVSEGISAYKESRAVEKERAAHGGTPAIAISDAGAASDLSLPPPYSVGPTHGHHHARSKSAGARCDEAHDDGFSSSSDEDEDEAQWTLDEAQTNLHLLPGKHHHHHSHSHSHSRSHSRSRSSSHSHKGDGSEEEEKEPTIASPTYLTDRFLTRYPIPADLPMPPPRLAAPVLLPQRRPKSKARGFIRAYAPALEDHGISQTAWLDFLETFDRASQASPWIEAVNLAQFATIALPPALGIAVSLALGVTVGVAKELHGRKRTNAFLHRVNREWFMPRGLYCLLLKWDETAPDAGQYDRTLDALIRHDAATDMTNDHGGDASGLARFKNKFHGPAAGDGGQALPAVAPLVFPGLEDALAPPSPSPSPHPNPTPNQQQHQRAQHEEKKGKAAAARAFVHDYYDRRARARYALENPDSALVAVAAPGERAFRSRYADPASGAGSGGLLGLVSGGKLGMGRVKPEEEGSSFAGVGGRAGELVDGGRRRGRRGRRAAYYEDEEYYGGRGRRAPRQPKQPRGLGRLLRKDVLYLLVVDLPSEADMQAARDVLGGEL